MDGEEFKVRGREMVDYIVQVRKIDRQIGRKVDRQINKQVNNPTYKHMQIYYKLYKVVKFFSDKDFNNYFNKLFIQRKFEWAPKQIQTILNLDLSIRKV